MSLPYIPSTDAGIRDWAANFSALITANPVSYGLTATDATTLAALNSVYATAYAQAVNPSTRTTASVAAKDAARANLLFTFRSYAIRINANPAITNMQRASLGITVRDRTPTPIPTPVTQPLIDISYTTPGVHNLRFSDALTPAARKKPFGVLQLQIFRTYGIAPVVDPTTAALVQVATKNPVLVPTDEDQQGKWATYFCRWITRKGLIGPWSAPASAIVA